MECALPAYQAYITWFDNYFSRTMQNKQRINKSALSKALSTKTEKPFNSNQAGLSDKQASTEDMQEELIQSRIELRQLKNLLLDSERKFQCIAEQISKHSTVTDTTHQFLQSIYDQINGTIGTASCIPHPELVENQLKKLGVAIEQSPSIVMITDPYGAIEYVNPMFTHATGYSAEEAIGHNPRILKSGLMPDSVYKDLWQTILSGKVWRGELQNKKKNGDLLWESVVISTILDNDGTLLNFVAVKEDITEQKKLLNELAVAKEKIDESERIKASFLANISHELRTTINGIIGFSEIMKDQDISKEEQTEYNNLIHRSALLMMNIINDLIDISRIDAGEIMLQTAESPVNELLHNIYAFFKSDIDSKGLRLSCTSGLPDNESIIETDSSKLTQILTNLIQNALKFTTVGGIDFGYTRNNTMLEFYVKDSGIGIPVEMHDKIFERFYQVDHSLTSSYNGSGLGLSISKAYVELLGGSLRVESAVGSGSKFLFSIPYNPPIFQLSGTPSSPLTLGNELLDSLSGLTILIVEDHLESSYLMSKSLSDESCIILYAANGLEAVKLVKKFLQINLVLMDIKMPVMDGLEATRHIKQMRPDLPVIAQSAFTSYEDREKASEAGCDIFITKPINKIELIKLIKKLMKR